jgi:hypothetical protein
MTTVIVGGALANKAGSGGEAWVRLSWAEGLRRLGLDVWLVEQIDPSCCVDTAGSPAAFEDSVNRAYFEEVVRWAGWHDRAALVCTGTPLQVEGAAWDAVTAAVADAALVVNISGHLREPALLRPARTRVYVDIDPGFTQVWHDQGADLGLAAHEHHVTIGVNIGLPGCPVPTGGFAWRPTSQPVVLDDWPVLPCPEPDRFTTIGSWRGPYGPLTHDGHTYGVKVHEFRKLARLPELARDRHAPPGRTRFEAAMAIHPADGPDRLLLERGGWDLVDPSAVAHPEQFRRYVQASGAEASAAQGVYVGTACGWFSDRSVRYLASGRPVLVQSTALESTLPVGQGLLTFTDLEGAVDGAAAIAADWSTHAEAARSIAEAHFAHDVVLPPLLDTCGVT